MRNRDVQQVLVQTCKLLSFMLYHPGARFSKVPKTFRARKAICEPANRLFRKADLLMFPGHGPGKLTGPVITGTFEKQAPGPERD